MNEEQIKTAINNAEMAHRKLVQKLNTFELSNEAKKINSLLLQLAMLKK